MVMRADVLAAAIDAAAAQTDARPRLLMSPRGGRSTRRRCARSRRDRACVIVAGRFEGVDERVIEARGLEEVSVGDYVLSGGEIAAMALLDAVVRLLPGVMGNAESAASESFVGGPPRISAIHPPAGLRGPADPRGAPVRRPRQNRSLAPRRGRADHPRAAAGPRRRRLRQRPSPRDRRFSESTKRFD